MSEEKAYPLSEKKRLALREEGMVPFSMRAQRAMLLALALFSLLLIDIATVKSIFENAYSLTPHTLRNETTLLLNSFWLLFYVPILLFFVSLVYRFIQTGALILPFGKYPSGILETEGRHTFQNTLSQIIALLVFVSLTTALIAWIDAKVDISGHTEWNTEVHFIVLIFASILALYAVSAQFSTYLRFLDAHKMSKAEIESEGES